jgi:signal transduction histidine kinase
VAVVQLAPLDSPFERVRSLSRIARALLAVRLTCCVMVAVWAMLKGTDTRLIVALVVVGGWFLLLLLRWSSLGVTLSTHPVLLAVDAAGCFVLLHYAATPLSPVLLLIGSGCLLSGLCLARRGAFVFSPVVVSAWWLVYASATGRDELAGPAEAFSGLVLVPVLLCGALFAGASIRNAALEASDAERTNREQIRVAGVAEERARLAREMHDSLIKSLHGIAMMADTLPRWVEISPERAQEQARLIAEQLHRAAKESRAMVQAMRRAPATASLGEMVVRSVEQWRRSASRQASVDIVGDPVLPVESAYELVAVLGEALENVERHTEPPAAARIALRESDAWVELTVEDDGGGSGDPGDPGDPGADAAGALRRPGHFGIVGMRERAARVGGDLRVTNVPGAGVSVRLRMPALVDEGAPTEAAPTGELTVTAPPRQHAGTSSELDDISASGGLS